MMAKQLCLGLVACILLGFTLAAQASTPTVLTASRSGADGLGETLSGSLKTFSGGAVPLQTVTISAIDTSARLGPAVQPLYGVVPTGAVNAQMGWKIGEDGACVCNGAAAAVVGGLTFTSNSVTDYAKIVPNGFPYPTVAMSVLTFNMPVNDVRDATLTAFTVDSNNVDHTVGQQFPVTAGSNFTFSAPMMATANAAQAGFIFVTFLNASGQVVSTSKIWFTPAQQTVTTVTTDINGNFSVGLGAHVYLADPQMPLSFAGNALFGASGTTVAPLGLNPANTIPALQQPVTSLGTSTAPLIWMSPLPDFMNTVNGSSGGWDSLYADDTTGWHTAAGKTQIMRFPAQWFSSFSADNIAWLTYKMNHANPPIYLAIEIEPNDLYYSNQPAGCTSTGCCKSSNGESYSDPSVQNTLIAKLMGSGANLPIVIMDEPFHFGYALSDAGSCRAVYSGLGLTYTPTNEAQNASLLLSIYKAAFPNLIYGDTEPFPALPLADTSWATDYAAFIQALDSQLGVRVSFMHMDLDWNSLVAHNTTVSSEVATVAPVVRNSPLSMKLGVIADGDHTENSAAAWMADAESNIWCILNSRVAPEQWAFETWDSQPTATTPDTSSTALTYLIPYYLNRTSGSCTN